MEISIKVEKILEPFKFVSKKSGEEMVKNTFVGVTQVSDYPKTIAFTVFGGDKFSQMGIVVGGIYNVSFEVESREWNGKYFTECNAWRAVRTDNGVQAPKPNYAPQPQNAPQQAQAFDNGSSSDAVPF